MTTNSLHYICTTLLVLGVIESIKVNGVYDIVIKIASDSLVKLKGTKHDIKNIRYNRINYDIISS